MDHQPFSRFAWIALGMLAIVFKNPKSTLTFRKPP